MPINNTKATCVVVLVLAFAFLTGCNSDNANQISTNTGTESPNPNSPSPDPEFPSAQWSERETENFARVLEAPTEQVSNPAFMQRFLLQNNSNFASYTSRFLNDPSWLLATPAYLDPTEGLDGLNALLAQVQQDPAMSLSLSFNTPLTPLCAMYIGPCTGDPFDYPEADPFYEEQAEIQPVVFYDRDCTRLNGQVWAPKEASPDKPLPAVVISTGSIQAPQTLYWWAAQSLVRAGYVVFTYDVRGQGRSDTTSPSGLPGGDLDPTAFYREMIDAIDFIQSSEAHPYPYHATCAASYPTTTASYNPFAAITDGQRIGLAGHSTGGYSVAVVQSYGEGGTEPWPGQVNDSSPVKAVVSWDGMIDPQGEFGAYGQLEHLEAPLYKDLLAVVTGQLAGGAIAVKPRVPTMMQFSDYGAAPIPYVQEPPAEAYKRGFKAWQSEDISTFAFTIKGSSHYEWSLLPLFPATSWCPKVKGNQCQGGWGLPMADHYTVAWFDRWLKLPDEEGYEDADDRLLDDALFGPRFSYHFESARDFRDRSGNRRHCESIRKGCD